MNGNFCTHCGQKSTVGKITLSNFIKELTDTVFQVDRGLFYSMKELFVNPGDSIREYLNGKRKSHFKPIAYVFTLSTIYFLLSQLLENGTFVNDFIEGFIAYEDTPGSASNEMSTFNWFTKNYAYTMLLLLPLNALASFIAFRGTGFNYLEHFVLNAYVMGQHAIFYSIASLLCLISFNYINLSDVAIFVSIVYSGFVYYQFFNKLNRGVFFFRFILMYIIYLIVITIILVSMITL